MAKFILSAFADEITPDFDGQLEALQKQLSEAASSAAKTEFELSAVRQQLREAEDEVLRRTEEEKQAAALRDAMEANLASIDAELQRIEARNGGDGGRLARSASSWMCSLRRWRRSFWRRRAHWKPRARSKRR